MKTLLEPKIEFRKVRDFGEIINDTFVFLKQLGKPLLKTIFIICGIIILAQGLSSFMFQIKMGNSIRTGITAASPIFSWEYLVTVVMGLLSYTLVSLTTLSFIHIYKEKGNETPTTQEVWTFVKFYIFNFTLISVLVGIMAVIGFVVCFIPGFYLWPVLSLIFPIMLIESTSFGYAFNKSFKLIKGHWWSTFGVQFIMVFLMYAGFFIISLPSIIIGGVDVFLKPGSSLVGQAFTSILGCLGYVVLILPTIGITFSYFSLSEQKDGVGLMERINNLGTQNLRDSQLPAEEY